jgi:hypothetical protein
MKGEEIYRHLRFFIHSGAHSARLVRHIMISLRRYNIDQVKTVTYESEDDGRIGALSHYNPKTIADLEIAFN